MLKIRKFLKPIVRSEIVAASCSRQHHTKELKLVEYGNIETSLKLETNEELHNSENNLKPGEVLVKLKASPINPADLNIIQGKYGILPESLPANLGNEGLFEVVKSNGANNRLRTGDLVLPVWKTGWGTWRSHAVANESIFYKVSLTDQQIPGLYQALATLTVNPPTAYRMLTNFVDLKPGDTVIQNGANSAVGQAAIQFAKIFKINLVNIVRKREKQDALNAYLKDLGAEYIFVEEDLRKSPLLTRELWEKIPRPRLALNCVGGKATTDMLRLMGKNATVVTYGGMSKQPVILNTADFIFKNLKACGFWLTVWKAENREEYEKTLDIIVDMIRKKEFKAPQCEEFKLDDYRDAFKRLQTPFISSKILFVN